MDSHAVAWFAGLMDGDGCFGTYIGQPTSCSRRLVPRIHLITTCRKTYARVHEILTMLEVGHHFTYRETPHPRGTEQNFRFSPRWDVNIVGMKRAAKLIPFLLPYLVTKGKEARLLLEFIDSRHSHLRGDDYTPRELEINTTLRTLKRTRNTSE